MIMTHKIGFFDSGVGGLFILRGARQAMPEYDYVYLGDTLNVPYGGKSPELIYDLTETAMRVLIEQHQCKLIIIACNTASVVALRRLQTEFLPNNYPDHRILGVVVPTLEAAVELYSTRIGLIATQYTVSSGIYEEEIQKINKSAQIISRATPLLVPLIEYEGEKYLDMVVQDYMEPILSDPIDSLILGCTHYVSIKDKVRELTNYRVRVLSQDEIIPHKLKSYLARHNDMNQTLSKNGKLTVTATDVGEFFKKNVAKIIDNGQTVEKVYF